MALKMFTIFVGVVILGLSIADNRTGNQTKKVAPAGCKGQSCPQPRGNKEDTFHPYSCLDYLKKGASECGVYKLFDTSGNSYPAYCDLQSEPGSAWTLVLSFSNSHRELSVFQKIPFKYNSPVNENAHNWNLYRLSLGRIKSLQAHPTHWRATCSYPKYGVDFRDYVRGNFKNFNIVDYLGIQQCKKVEYINIRGHTGIHLTVPFWQKWCLHVDSSYDTCEFNATSGSVSSEDNFGCYWSMQTMNPKFRCTEESSSTTQWWFGGHL